MSLDEAAVRARIEARLARLHRLNQEPDESVSIKPAELIKLLDVAEAALAFDATLLDWPYGHERDALRAALAKLTEE